MREREIQFHPVERERKRGAEGESAHNSIQLTKGNAIVHILYVFVCLSLLLGMVVWTLGYEHLCVCVCVWQKGKPIHDLIMYLSYLMYADMLSFC